MTYIVAAVTVYACYFSYNYSSKVDRSESRRAGTKIYFDAK